MPYNGSGQYNAPSSTWNPAVANTNINPSDWNALLTDLSTALSTAITKDGQTTPTADLPMGGYRHTSVNTAAARNQYAAASQVQDSSFLWGGTSGGTGDAQTLSMTPAITAYAAGQVFFFIAGATNTTATTMAINGLTAKAIQSGGSALTAGQITSGLLYSIIYDGTQFQLANFSIPGSLANVAYLNVAQLWTKAQGCANYGLTDAATITPDLSLQPEMSVQLGGNRTLGVPSNLVAGKRQRFVIDVWQDATGSRTLSYAWAYRWANGSVGTLSTAGLTRDKLFGDVAYYGTSTVTITIATPGVVSWTAHGLQSGSTIQLTTTGALPTGLTASTTYFVIVIDANSFWLATSLVNAAAGTKINTSGSQSGVHTATALAIDLSLLKAFA